MKKAGGILLCLLGAGLAFGGVKSLMKNKKEDETDDNVYPVDYEDCEDEDVDDTEEE